MPAVILVEHITARADTLRESLLQAEFEVVATLRCSKEMLDRVGTLEPDAILASLQLPDRDVVNDVTVLMQRRPCPIVAYAGRRDSKSISRAIAAGVSAYVADDIATRDLGSLLDLAFARFRQMESMRSELRKARTALEDRKRIDKAKALLVKCHGIDESDAHKTLQQIAMNQRITLGQAANNIVGMLTALHKGQDRQ